MPYGISEIDQIGSGKDRLLDGTKPLPEQVLTNHQWGLSPEGNFTGNHENIYPSYEFGNY